MEDRVTRLEEKLCFSEDLLDDLNRIVYQQQQQIAALQAELRALREQIQAAYPGENRTLRDELPPHY